MRAFYITLIIIILASSASAQLIEDARAKNTGSDYLGLKPADKPFSLIDLSRIKWSHSYSFGYFSGGGTSGSVGLYSGSIFYELSSALSLDLSLGVLHNPGSFFNRNVSSDAAFLPGLSLDYHPSEHFRMTVGIQSYPGAYYYPSSPYDYRWRYGR